MKSKILTSLFFFLLLICYGYSQKLKSDEGTCKIKEIKKEILRTCGNNNIIYKGVIEVKSKTKWNGLHSFYFAEMGNNTSLFTVKDKENKPLNPSLLFDDLTREFIYNKGKEDQQKIQVSDDKTENEIILEAMIFWLKLKREIQ